ncbi:hypothetical protein IJG98_02730 [Candidatus Saccharibacteria bacterium]|nr:hypothetical protein [Candidatus Saccharibacteria bacterium]
MKNPTKTYYAVVYMELSDNIEEPEESRYYTHTKVVALSDDYQAVAGLATALNTERQHSYDAKTAADVIAHYQDYVGCSLFVTDTLNLDEKTVKDYEEQGRVIGHPGFVLRIYDNPTY